MKKHIFITALCLFGLLSVPTVVACVGTGTPSAAAASTNMVTRQIELTEFDALELSTSGDILFTPTDGELSATLSVPASVSDDVEVYVKGGELVFRNKVGANLILPRDTKMTLTVKAPMVKKININGSGDVKILAAAQVDSDLKIMINGSGNVKFTSALTVSGNLKALLSGSGNVEFVSAQCQELGALVNGSGDLKGKSLQAESLSVSVNGSGDTDIDHVEATKISTAVKGSGDVDLSGTCDEASFIVVGSGDVKAESLEARTVSVKIVGSGNVRCNPTEKLSVNRIGSGTIGYKGDPTITGLVKKGLYKL